MTNYFLLAAVFLLPISASAETEKNRIKHSDALTSQRIFIDSNNITFDEFLNAYKSDSQKERRYAEMYFLGVLDYTEGISWCSYKQIKSGTIAEWIEPLYEKADDKTKKQRAARVISSMLSKEFPCGGKK